MDCRTSQGLYLNVTYFRTANHLFFPWVMIVAVVMKTVMLWRIFPPFSNTQPEQCNPPSAGTSSTLKAFSQWRKVWYSHFRYSVHKLDMTRFIVSFWLRCSVFHFRYLWHTPKWNRLWGPQRTGTPIINYNNRNLACDRLSSPSSWVTSITCPGSYHPRVIRSIYSGDTPWNIPPRVSSAVNSLANRQTGGFCCACLRWLYCADPWVQTYKCTYTCAYSRDHICASDVI